MAKHCDWGVVDMSREGSADKKKKTAEKKAKTAKEAAAANPFANVEEAKSSRKETVGETASFMVKFDPKAVEGESIEIQLPGNNKILAYVGGSTAVDTSKKECSSMQVDVAFGRDGVFYALLPKGGLDPAAMAAARSKEAGEARMAALNEAAAGAPDNIEAAQGAASEISSMFGFGGS